MCERYEDLKKYSVSITKGLYEISELCGKCHQTRGISCAVYRQNAFTVQLAQAEEEFQKLSETMENQVEKAV